MCISGSRNSPERQLPVNSISDAGTCGATENAAAARSRVRDASPPETEIRSAPPDCSRASRIKRLKDSGDGRDRPAPPAHGVAPPGAIPRSRALRALRQRIEEVTGGVWRSFAQAEDAIHVMRHLSVGTVAEIDAVRSPVGHEVRLLPSFGQAIAEEPAFPVEDVLGQGVVDPSRLRLCLPALYRCALHLAQGVFLVRLELFTCSSS